MLLILAGHPGHLEAHADDHLYVLVVEEVAQFKCAAQHKRCDVSDDLCSLLLVVGGVPFGQAYFALPAQQEHEPDSLPRPHTRSGHGILDLPGSRQALHDTIPSLSLLVAFIPLFHIKPDIQKCRAQDRVYSCDK